DYYCQVWGTSGDMF
nr:immunoglobulin light chain junction region [Macaca mulatta]